MVQLNRINYEGLDRRYILDQIKQSLDDSDCVDKILEENEIPETVHFYTSDDAKREIENSGNVFMKALTGIAFKHKERIKAIPIVGDYAVRIKESYLMREGRIKDVSHLLSLDINPFIHGCYKELLNREADPAGFAVYQRMTCEGAPKEAIIYMLANSAEFNSRFLIKDSLIYKKCYSNYKIKNAIRKTPGLNYLLSLVMLPVRVWSLIVDAKINEANRREREMHQLDMLSWLKQDVSVLSQNNDRSNQALAELKRNETEANNRLQNLIDRIIKLNEESREKVFELQTVLDNHLQDAEGIKLEQELISNGILNIPSYLEGVKGETKEALIKGFSKEDKFYYYVGNLFRGREDLIKNQQRRYLDYVKTAYANTGKSSFIDIGCGRGEFIELLKANDIDAIGIEMNEAIARTSLDKGLNVVIGDGKEFLEDSTDESFSGISLFQVAEHMKFQYLFDLCSIGAKKIKRGGCILIETTNPYCYRKLGTYSADPSHIFMPSPDALKLMLETLDFRDVIIRFYAPVQEKADRKENLMNYYEGYCLIARKG